MDAAGEGLGRLLEVYQKQARDEGRIESKKPGTRDVSRLGQVCKCTASTVRKRATPERIAGIQACSEEGLRCSRKLSVCRRRWWKGSLRL